MPAVADETIPAKYLDPEGDAERQDPELVMEATTSTLRSRWDACMCRRGGGDYSDVAFFGKRIGGVPVPAIDAYAPSSDRFDRPDMRRDRAGPTTAG